MYMNSAYWNNSRIDFKTKEHPLFVGSCGTYRLIERPVLPTHRPRGRLDFQLLYVAAGKAHFFFQGEERIVPAGSVVIYRPKEEQKYRYYGADKTEVFWVHFTGGNVRNILREYGIADSDQVIRTGTSLEFTRLFCQMIRELQLRRENYEQMLVLLLRRLLILIQRQAADSPKVRSSFVESEMNQALNYFQEGYYTPISVEDYASSRGMSTSWFIRSFKDFTGVTPMHYILALRIANAQSLLENTDYTVAEISRLVGYEDQLYFSRLFKKQSGLSPSQFRRQVQREE